MMKRLIAGVLSGVLAVMTFVLPVFAQDPSESVPTCIGRTGSVIVTARMQMLPAALEIDLVLENAGTVPVQFDPAKAVLRTKTASLVPWTADEAKGAHRDLGGYIFAGALLGPLGLVVTGASQLSFNRYVDSRAFRPVEVQPTQAARGSLFFPVPASGGVRAALELSGLTLAAGESPRSMPIYCVLPRVRPAANGDASQPREQQGGRVEGEPGEAAAPVSVMPSTAPAGLPPMTVTLFARGSAGPAEVIVTAVEFAAGYTAVELAVANRGPGEADVFAALASATLRGGSGNPGTVRTAQSDFADRVPPGDRTTARLVFDPLPQPPQTSVATLTVPGIRYGFDTVDVVVELRF